MLLVQISSAMPSTYRRFRQPKAHGPKYYGAGVWVGSDVRRILPAHQQKVLRGASVRSIRWSVLVVSSGPFQRIQLQNNLRCDAKAPSVVYRPVHEQPREFRRSTLILAKL